MSSIMDLLYSVFHMPSRSMNGYILGRRVEHSEEAWAHVGLRSPQPRLPLKAPSTNAGGKCGGGGNGNDVLVKFGEGGDGC